jgi:MFS family permease
MWSALKESWTLFVGMAFLMVSNGLLATLLTLRASGLGFSDGTIGLMQSAYPLGALFGCLYAPRLVAQAGHPRAFAALASIASAASLLHLVTYDPWSWSAMRALTGFCFSGLYVVAESWLNGQASNQNRASLLSVYFVIQSGGAAAGQLLLNLASPEGVLLFVVVSILISLSLVPILIVARTAPQFEVPERISLWALIRLGLALYGAAVGFDAGLVGALIGVCTLGGMAAQFPIGRLSDRIDRRLAITGCAGLALPLCLVLAALGDQPETTWPLFLGVAALGGLVLPIYSLCVAHTNDYLRPAQVVAASGTLVLVLNGGIILGPTLGAVAVGTLGPSGLFLLLAMVQGLIFRLWRGQARVEQPGRAMAIHQTATQFAAQLNPEAPPVAKVKARE